MKHGQLQEEILAEIAAALASSGYRRREQEFYRDVDDVRWFLHIAFVRHPENLDLIADVAIRHNAIEDRLVGTRAHLKPSERKRTATIGVDLGNYADGRQQRWTIRSADEVKPVVADMIRIFQKFGLSFLERFSSLHELVRVLDLNDREASLICPVPATRVEVAEVARAILGERAA